MPRNLNFNPKAEEAHQEGMGLSTRLYHDAAAYYFDRAKEVIKEHPGDLMADAVHLARIARDQGLDKLRQAASADDFVTVIGDAEKYMLDSVRSLENIVETFPVDQEDDGIEVIHRYIDKLPHIEAELGASRTALGRLGLLAHIRLDGGQESLLNVLKSLDQGGADIPREPAFVYYNISNLLHTARAESLWGNKKRRDILAAKAQLAIRRAMESDQAPKLQTEIEVAQITLKRLVPTLKKPQNHIGKIKKDRVDV